MSDRSEHAADDPVSAIDQDTVPSQRSDVVMVPVAEEAVLLDERTGALHALDSLATLMWQCFDGTATLAEIATDVAEVFSVDELAALRDLLQLTSDLSARGLLEGTGPASATAGGVGEATESGFLRNPPDP